LREGAVGTAALLTVAYGVAQLDRNTINLLLPAIQGELGLSDFEAGLLSGPAFAILFSIASIPIGLLADRIDRRWILGFGLAAWSVLTGLCATARSFAALFSIRLGVGIGEATLAPCAYPILAEIFPKSFTGRAIGLYVAGAGLLSGLAIAAVGRLPDWLSASQIAGAWAPWRVIFVIIAIPGLFLALLSPTISPGSRAGRATGATATGLERSGAPALLFFGSAAFYAVLYILLVWTPSIFIREFDMTARDAGNLLGGEQILSGVFGTLTGAWLADRAGPARRVSSALTIATTGLTFMMAGLATIVSSPNAGVAIAGALGGALFGGLGTSVLPMAVQESSAPSSRSRSTAIFMLTINLFGTGLGPPLAGRISDFLGPHHLSSGAAIAGGVVGIVGIGMLLRLRHILIRALPD
jgi:MFS family permease